MLRWILQKKTHATTTPDEALKVEAKNATGELISLPPRGRRPLPPSALRPAMASRVPSNSEARAPEARSMLATPTESSRSQLCAKKSTPAHRTHVGNANIVLVGEKKKKKIITEERRHAEYFRRST